MGAYINGDYKSEYSGDQIDAAIGKVRTPDSTPTASSDNLVTSGGVKAALDQKQAVINDLSTIRQGASDGTAALTATNEIEQVMAQGYKYYGVATPNTNPGTLEQRVFYIASQPGTYTNLGGIVVNDGEVCTLMWNETSWSKQVTGAATAAQVSQLGQQVIYDVSANNSGASFASLSALLSSENLSTLIPVAVRCGGMSIRFVQSSDNKYVQYKLMNNTWSIDTADWAICSDTILIDNPEFVDVKTDSEDKILEGIKTDGTKYIGGDLEVGGTIHNADLDSQIAQIAQKVDKEPGKSLIDAEFATSQGAIQNSEYLQATTDLQNKIVEGIKTDGTKVINVPIETQCLRHESIENPYWLQVIADYSNKLIEGINTKGEKHVSKFDKETEDMIKEIAGTGAESTNIINIPILDENFTSPVPVTITGTKGNENAKYEFKLPLKEGAFNIRFKFKITENLLNQNKNATIAKLGAVDAITAVPAPLSQYTTSVLYDNEQKTMYWPCFNGGIRLNGSAENVGTPDQNKSNIGLFAFYIRYTGNSQNVTIENNGNGFILKIDGVSTTFDYVTYPTVYELYNALQNTTDIIVDFNELEGRTCDELAIFPESKLAGLCYTATDGSTTGAVEEYYDSAPFFIPYAVDNEWHQAEIVKIDSTVYAVCDGQQMIINADSSILTLGGECGVIFNDFEVHTDSSYDAEVTDMGIVSSVNPFVIIFEGHGMVHSASQAISAQSIYTSPDRLHRLFEHLRGKGYVPVSINEIAQYYEGNKMLPKRCYVPVFDDFEFENCLELYNRAPFEKFGVYPVLALISEESASTPIIYNGNTITINEAADICKMHNFHLVSHTRNHRNCNAIKPSLYMSELSSDIYDQDPKGIDSGILVYPFGRCNPYLFDVLRWMGFRLGIDIAPSSFNKRITSPYKLRRMELGIRNSLENLFSEIV